MGKKNFDWQKQTIPRDHTRIREKNFPKFAKK